MDRKMFVVNEDDEDTSPRQVFFDLKEAVKDGAMYIDVFDKTGIREGHYEREEGEYIFHKVS